MALFPRVTTWVSNQVLTAAALNGEFNNILNNAQASSWIGFSANVAQMQQQTTPGGVGTESLAGSISDELQRLRYVLAFTLGQTYWYNMTGRNLGAGNLAVQTADIAANAVTRPKLVAVGQQVSVSSGTFSTTSGTYVDVTNLTVTITTTGRPVCLRLQTDASAGANPNGILVAGTAAFSVALLRGASIINIDNPGILGAGGSMTYPAGSFSFLDVIGAGTYTYKIQAKTVGGTSISFINCYLVAYEL